MPTSSASSVRRLRVLLVLALVTLAAPQVAQAGPYGWPLEPFDRQHPVRGFFGDPRIGEAEDGHVESKSFHFGIDISAADGTPVNATASGRIVWEPERPETIAIRAADGTVFAYWHIRPAVRNGAQAVAYKTVLGHIAAGWGHVHLAELVGGRYVIWDQTPVPVPGKWGGKPVMAAKVRWRIVGGRRAGTAWTTALDLTGTIPAPSLFDTVYAPWTRQNHAWRAGRYRVLLARGWNPGSLPSGAYRLEVEAADTRGNRTRRSTSFSVVS